MTVQRTWVQAVFQPLVVATMMTCLAVSVVQLLHVLVPTWSGVYLTLIVFLAALEAVAAGRLVRRHRLRGRELLGFRAGEWLLILIALKLGSYAAQGVDTLLADITLWREDIGHLFTIEYFVAIFLTLLAWAMATSIESDLTELAVPDVGVPSDREGIRSRLMTRFYQGGLILLIVAGVARIGIAQILNRAHPPVPGMILNALLYFVLGLLLLSQARLTVLQIRWQAQDIPAATDIDSRWSRSSLIFVLLAVIVSLVLPTSYSFGLLESIGLLLGLTLQIVYFLVGLLAFILFLPFLLLTSLLPGEIARRVPQPAFPSLLPAAPSSEAGGPSPLAVLRTLIFWALVLGIVIYALRSYVGYREDILAELRVHPRLRRLWAVLISLWRQLWGAAADAVAPLRRRLPGGMPEGAAASSRRLWPWRRLASMSPRERIQYYYLSIVRRGRAVGQPRRLSETPYEYSAALRRQKPDVEPELADLTEGFIEARYSRHAITDEQAGLLRQSWNRIKRVLRS